MTSGRLHAVICMLNSKYVHSSLAPWYLLAGVKAYGDDGITAEVVEGTVNQELDAIVEAVVSKKPDVIGFCCYIWNIARIRKLLPLVKSALPGAVIVLGGPEVSYNAGDILAADKYSYIGNSYIGINETAENASWGRLVDFIIAGEGERPFALLLNALAPGRAAPCGDVQSKRVPGVCYRRDGRTVINPPYYTDEEPPDPYGEEYFSSLKGRIAYLETSRGCPFSCAFCLSGTGQSVRWFSLERAKNDILRLGNSGTQTVKFVDRTFNADRARAREIFKFISDSYGKNIPAGVCFHFEIAGDLLDDETFELLAAMPKGAVQFEIGLQSFNEETLSAIRRKTDVGLLKNNIARLVSMGNSHIHIDLIAGLPLEDMGSFADGFNTAYALRPHMLQLGFLKLLHGAAMREQPEAYPCRYAAAPPYEVYETPWLSPDALRTLHDTEDAVERLYNSGRFGRTLEYVLAASRRTPFALFAHTGRLLRDHQCVSLDTLTALLLDFFGKLPGVNQSALRDQMVRDRLATNASGKLPAVLKQADAHRKLTGSRRGAAVLPSEDVLITVDYNEKDPVTGRYTLRETKWQE